MDLSDGGGAKLVAQAGDLAVDPSVSAPARGANAIGEPGEALFRREHYVAVAAGTRNGTTRWTSTVDAAADK